MRFVKTKDRGKGSVMSSSESYSTRNIKNFRATIFVMIAFPIVVATVAAVSFYASSKQSPESYAQQATTSEVVAEVLISGLDTPWSMQFSPDGKLYFTERKGVIKVYTGSQVKTVATLTSSVEGSEEGLQGLVLHPNFSSNGWLYAYYTYNSGGLKNRIVRYTLNPSTATVSSGPTTILEGIPGYRFHNGGRIKFGPDGKLYVATGAATPDTSAQDKSSLAGKILRLNDDGSGVSDNPFPENRRVYSMGHRNPQGLAWHPVTKELWATEHGPSGSPPYCCNDEVNKIVKGGNYGWPRYYGSNGQDSNYSYFNITHIKPVWTSGTSSKWAPAGAMFYSGGPLGPPWTNSLIFAGLGGIDKSNQALFRIRLASDNKTPTQIDRLYHDTYGRLRDVIQGPDGAIYMATSNYDGRGNTSYGSDKIIRLKPVGLPVPNPAPAPAPAPAPSPSPAPTPQPSPSPSPPPQDSETVPEDNTPVIKVPGADGQTTVKIPENLDKNDEGQLTADFDGDGLNDLAYDLDQDGSINPEQEIVIKGSDKKSIEEYKPLTQTIETDEDITIKAGPLPEAKISKPVAYTFIAYQGAALISLASYLAITKLAIFAGLKGKLGL